jgi:methylated-DNA-protein-cysteine methyltransferase-like protein
VNEFERRVLDIVGELQPGQIVSYGWVASEAGRPRAARAVGAVLAGLGDDAIPWWRVVQSSGRIVSPRPQVQRALLLDEGVVVAGDRVVEPPVQRP